MQRAETKVEKAKSTEPRAETTEQKEPGEKRAIELFEKTVYQFGMVRKAYTSKPNFVLSVTPC